MSIYKEVKEKVLYLDSQNAFERDLADYEKTNLETIVDYVFSLREGEMVDLVSLSEILNLSLEKAFINMSILLGVLCVHYKTLDMVFTIDGVELPTELVGQIVQGEAEVEFNGKKYKNQEVNFGLRRTAIL